MQAAPLLESDRRWIRMAGGLAFVIGVAGAVGCLADIKPLARWVPGDARMVLNSALCALLAGAGFLALIAERRRSGAACGIFLVGFGGLNLADRLAAPAAKIGEPLWRSHLFPAGAMGANTAIAFILTGLALLFLATRRAGRGVIAIVAGVVAALAVVPLIQYGAAWASHGTAAPYHGMALPTSCALLALASAMLRTERAPSDGALTYMSAALGMLFSICAVVAAANGQLVEAGRSVEETFQVRADLSRFLEQVARAESAARGYAFTGTGLLRSRALLHEADARQRVHSLGLLVAGSPSQVARIAQLHRLVEEKFAQNEALLRAAQIQGTAAGADYLRTLLAQPGQPTSNLVGVTDEVEVEEQRLLGERQGTLARLELSTRLVEITGTLIAVALLAAAVIVTRRAARARAEAEAMFRGSFEDAGIGMALVGLDGGWLRVNRSLRSILGYTEEELARLTFQDLTHPEDLEMDLEQLTALVAGQGHTYQLQKRYIHRDGHHVWANLTVSIVRTPAGQPLHFISQIEDITARRVLEAEVIKARDEALAAATLKSDFLATMSHEIRTPMNGVLGMTELLSDSALNFEQREMTDTIRSSAESLLRVLNDILDFSKMDAGKLPIRADWFVPNQLIHEALALAAPQARDKGLELRAAISPAAAAAFWGDAGRIRQILNNLIGNAVKFTESGSVLVSASMVQGAADQPEIRIEVRDTGIGIAPTDQSRLFESFSQVESSHRRRYGGTGLGLAISKRLVELMGGRIGLSSQAGQGAVFWFELPLKSRPLGPQDEPANDARPALPNARAGCRILVAEDNPAGRTVASKTLQKMGYAVDVVADGSQALAQLHLAHYDAILIDCQMPVMDGYEATRRIRAGEIPGLNRQIPIIALTASALAEDRAKCLAAGMNEYLTKPLRFAELGAALERLGCARGPGVVPAGKEELRLSPPDPRLDREVIAELQLLPGSGGAALWPEIRDNYLSQATEALGSLELAVRERNLTAVADGAHTLAGGSATVGARRMAESAVALEQAAGRANWDEIQAQLAALQAQLGPLRQQLRAVT